MSDLENEMRRQRHERGNTHTVDRPTKYSAISSMIRPILKGIELFSPLTSILGGPGVKVFNVASGILEKLI
jgi:hypothetical protein